MSRSDGEYVDSEASQEVVVNISSFWQQFDYALSHKFFGQVLIGAGILLGALGGIIGRSLGYEGVGALIGLLVGLIVGLALEVLQHRHG